MDFIHIGTDGMYRSKAQNSTILTLGLDLEVKEFKVKELEFLYISLFLNFFN